ncbi:response regulator receiver domain-containing protein [Aquabacterium commune]|uniref:Response regulator receiver domain-containing protein n=2 Tax=Burkholderiales genera incertae sedis TaxID=224471 RepID=A0A4R6R6L6_9BURK|nr:response regulator receiver domain-containing protein [Aquabacterium commune]
MRERPGNSVTLSRMDASTYPDKQPQADELSAGWMAGCVSDLLGRHGVSPRHQATEIAQICAISISQARRKLRGAVWLFGEILALCRHYGESLDAVFAQHAVLGALPFGAGVGVGAASGGGDFRAGQPALLLADALELPCTIHLGAQCTPSATDTQELLATHLGQSWVVGSAARVLALNPAGACYRIEQLQLESPDDQPRLRIAVLDDDPCAAQTLVDWFHEMGFDAEPFTSADALLQPLQAGSHFDAYVVDLILSGGQTSQSVVEEIRRRQAQVPIILLTGQLRDGTASEATLATMLRTQGVTFFEKPVRPAVLTAAIQSSLDRLQAPPSPQP